MTKGCIIENNTDIKENHVYFSNKRCLISQKLISNSNSSSKSNKKWITELKKDKINNIKNVIIVTSHIKLFCFKI